MTRALPGAALAALVLCFVVVAWRTAAPPVKPASVSPDQFSAERAFAVLRTVLPTRAPHPTGSVENRKVRERIEARLRELGWSVREQKAPICSRYGVCAEVVNIVADREAPPGPRLLLAAHYDSVAAGPGASDDGMGVATLLEVARALGHRQARLPVTLLFTDGEEAGLLGAEAFVKTELAKYEIAALVNVEARGTSGPALLFETSGANDWLVSAYARSADRPVTSSLFPAVYERLPNDTDLSVFRRAGVPGVNFANIGGIGQYHTPLDDLEHFSLGTLQHHGDGALGLTAELGARPEAAKPALFFDVLGLGVVRMSLSAAPWLYAATALLWAGVLSLALRRGARATRFSKGVGLFVGFAVAMSLGGFGQGELVRAVGSVGSGWPAHPEPFFLGLGALSVALALLAGRQVEAGGPELWLATWTVVGFVGLGAVLYLREASFLFIAPWLTAAVVGLATRVSPARFGIMLLVPAVVGALLWLPVLLLAYDALGLTVPLLFAACAAVGLGGFLPALAPVGIRARRLLLGSCAVAWVVCTSIACFVPAFSATHPQRLSLAYHLDTDSGQARFLVDASSGPVPRAVTDAGRFAATRVDSAPTFVGWRPEALEAQAPVLALPAPSAESVAHGIGASRRVRVRSLRGADTLSLHFAPDSRVTRVTFRGISAPLRPGTHSRSLTLVGVGPEGEELELSGEGPLAFVLSDHTPGLPSGATALAGARPVWAQPSQAGDETVVSRKLLP